MANKVVIVVAGENQFQKVANEVSKQLAGMQSQFSAFDKVLAGIGIGAIASQMVDFAKGILESADALSKMAQKTGISIESLSGLAYAAKLSDVEVEGFSKGLGLLAKNMSAAQAGAGEARDAFKAMGISVTDASGHLRSTEDVLAEIADKFAGAKDDANKAALSMKLFGRAGADMIPFLNGGSRGIREMTDEASNFGVVVSKEFGVAAEHFNDNLKRMEERARGVTNQFLAGLLPALNDLTDAYIDLSKNVANDPWKDAGAAAGQFIKNMALVGQGFNDFQLAIVKSAQITAEFFGGNIEGARKAVAELESLESQYLKLVDLVQHPRGPISKLFSSDNFDFGRGLDALNAMFPPAKEKSLKGVNSEDAAKNLKALTDLREAAAQREAAIAESSRKTQLAALELEKTMGLVTLEDYYKQRLNIITTGLDAEISALEDKAVASANKMAQAKDQPGKNAAAAELQKALSEVDKKTEERKQLVLQTSAEEIDAQRQLANLVLGYEAEIQVAKGDTAAAAIQAIRTEFEERRRQMAAAGKDTGGLDTLQAQREAAAKAEALATQIELAYQRIQNGTQRIANLVATHQITEIEGERLMNQLRLEGANNIQAMVDEYGKLAQASNNPQLLAGVDNLKLKQDELRIKVSEVRDTVVGDLQSGFMNFFDSVATGSETAGQAFGNFALSVMRSIEQMIAKMIAMAIVMKVIGFFTSFAGGGDLTGGLSLAHGNIGGGVMPHAMGGSMRAGEIGLVGERGPELFVPNTSGRIIPNSQLGSMRGGGNTFAITIHAPNSDVEAVRQLESKMPSLLEGAVQRAVAVTEDLRIRRGM